MKFLKAFVCVCVLTCWIGCIIDIWYYEVFMVKLEALLSLPSKRNWIGLWKYIINLSSNVKSWMSGSLCRSWWKYRLARTESCEVRNKHLTRRGINISRGEDQASCKARNLHLTRWGINISEEGNKHFCKDRNRHLAWWGICISRGRQ